MILGRSLTGEQKIMEKDLAGAVEPKATAAPAALANRCANCGALLAGPYCSMCGQHAHGSARSLTELCQDCVHVLTHADGRFWKTIRALLLSPGKLTQEYFLDHRERYLPPVRLYIVLSILFFGMAQFFDSGIKPSVNMSPADAAAASAGQAQAIAAARAECAKDDGDDSQLARSIRAKCVAALEDNGAAVKKQIDDVTHCNVDFKPVWLQRRVVGSCQRAVKDGGASFIATLKQNVPRMMFILLPLVAAFMLPLYRRPRRLYVEHLVYFLHTQAAMYLAFILFLLLKAVTNRVPGLRALTGFVNLALLIYAIWYWYISMRRAYGQGRGRTLGKLIVVGTAYMVCLLLATAATLTVSFLQG
jgi:Protein of unknown function (DUF3667)